MTSAVKSTCPYCGVGCGLRVTSQAEGWRIEGDPEHPANFGRLCSKGAALGETLSEEGRLITPLIGGREATWDQALDQVADRFQQVIHRHGPDAVAFYVSGQLLTEDYYVANKLMKGFIGSGNIDTNSRLCMSSAVAGHKRAFGADTVPGCYEDFELADLVILTGSNTAWCHPVLYQRIAKAKKERPGMRVVVIDPRTTATCDLADLHIPLRAGTDSLLFSGLLAWLAEMGRIDEAFVQAHTDGLEEALRLARWYAPSPQLVAEQCGVETRDILQFYRWFGETERTLTLFSQGINQTSSGTDKVNAIINCHLLTGRIGKPGQGPFSMTGQPNAMGGREVGALSNQLAGHLDFGQAAHRKLLSRFWGCTELAHRPGLKAVDLFQTIERGKIKALWVMATNPAVSMPDTNRVRAALHKCDFLVVSESVRDTDTTAFADVLLPAHTWGEKDGTVTNSERRISRQQPFLQAAGMSMPDWWIVSQVAKRMGYTGFDYTSTHEIFLEHASLSGYENNGARDFDISGLSAISADEYDNLTPIQWPVKPGQASGTERMFADGRFFTATGRAQFIGVTPRPPASALNRDYPLVLNTGRIRDQWHTMSRTGKSPRLSGRDPEPFVEVSPQDARRFGVEDDELVRVSSHWGGIIVRGKVTDRVRPGQVFTPMHWNDQFASNARTGSLVNPAVDPVSGQPEFKHTPVTLEPYRPAWQGFLLSREAVSMAEASYWTCARRQGLWHYELAGEQSFRDWSAVARQLLIAPGEEAQLAEMLDQSGGHYRCVSIRSARLEACLFIGPDHQLPSRDWLVQLFAKPELTLQERQRLLAGSPGKQQEDTGSTICACFNVGENTLIKAIREQGLCSTEAIGKALHAGTNCGSCLSEINGLIQAHRQPVAVEQ